MVTEREWIAVLGSSFSFFVQMMIGLFQASYNWTAIVSIIFTILPLILGLAVLKIVRAENWESMQSRKISLVVIGIIAPFAWTGLYLGPIMVIAAGLVPLFKQ